MPSSGQREMPTLQGQSVFTELNLEYAAIGLDDLFGLVDQERFVRCVRKENQEFVPAKSCDGIPRAEEQFQAGSGFRQYGVPKHVAVRIVDLLEVIKIKQQHREAF